MNNTEFPEKPLGWRPTRYDVDKLIWSKLREAGYDPGYEQNHVPAFTVRRGDVVLANIHIAGADFTQNSGGDATCESIQAHLANPVHKNILVLYWSKEVPAQFRGAQKMEPLTKKSLNIPHLDVCYVGCPRTDAFSEDKVARLIQSLG